MANIQAAGPRSRRFPTIEIAGVLVAMAAIATAPNTGRLSGALQPAESQVAVLIGEIPIVGDFAGSLGSADGVVRAGTSVFDDVPAIANLDTALIDALRRAAKAAAAQDVRFVVDSGWRSVAYQQQLFDAAVAEYGSEDEAARWVARPEGSAHVTGDAVDIGPASAATWLRANGARFGLCQIYRNEAWHFELRRDAATDGCPKPLPDARSAITLP